MYRYIYLIILLSATVFSGLAQIGVNTESPVSVFHIDPLRNTNPAIASTYSDDVVFDNGKLGLGILLPQKTLDLKSSFKYSDGNEALDYVLYVDEHKNINWEREKPVYPPLISIPAATIGNALKSVVFPNNSINTYRYSGLNITLTEGVWLLYFKFMYDTWWGTGTSGNMRALISSSSTGNGLGSMEGAVTSSASTNGAFGYFSGYVFLSVLQPSKTYYLWLGYISGLTTINAPAYDTAKSAGVNSFYAIRYSKY